MSLIFVGEDAKKFSDQIREKFRVMYREMERVLPISSTALLS